MKPKEDKSILYEWAETTTAHGFGDFFKARSIIAKIIWFFLIALSLSLMIYQLYRVISDYSSNKWSTTVQDISTDGLPLPTLVVCNANRIKKSKAKQYNMTDDLINYLFINMDTLYYLKKENYSAEESFIAWRKANNFSYMDIFDKLAPSFQDIFISSGIIDKNFVKQPIDTLDYGRCQCYDANRTSTVVGSKGGLVLVLDTQGWDYVPLYYHNYLYEGIAVKMAYNCRTEIGQWTTLHPGTRTSIGMQVYENTVREQERSPSNPFSYLASEPPCKRNASLMFADRPVDWYTVENCLKECEWLRAVRQCNCIPYTRNSRYRTCEVEELRKCHGGNDTLIFSDENGVSNSADIIAEIENCRATCEKPCFNKYVDVQTTMTKAPSQAQIDNHLIDLIMAFTRKYVRMQDLIVLEIYFNSLSIKSIQLFEVMTMEDLVSSAGGLIGLWAGMSFLTIFQAIDYFIDFLKIRALRRSESKIKPSISKDDIYKF